MNKPKDTFLKFKLEEACSACLQRDEELSSLFCMLAFVLHVFSPAFTTNYLAHEHVVLPGRVVVYGLRVLEQEPDDVDEDLDEDEPRTEDDLRLRGDEAGPLGRPLRSVEDARYSEREGNRENDMT
jgi:hypothetical protein